MYPKPAQSAKDREPAGLGHVRDLVLHELAEIESGGVHEDQIVGEELQHLDGFAAIAGLADDFMPLAGKGQRLPIDRAAGADRQAWQSGCS